MSAPANTRRSRPRFFLMRRTAAGRTPRPSASHSLSLPPKPATATDRAPQSERARFAAAVDLELRLACRSEAGMRRELGCATRALLRHRAYRRLGFVRLSDYARERLGVSARTLQSAAWLATRLDELPAVSRAYDRSELSWAQARAICKVAVAGDQERWLAVARRSTVATLERLVERAARPHCVPPDPEGESNEIDGEPAVRWRLACPARVRALWRRALALASRVAGEPLAEWRAAEVIAAEGASGRPAGQPIGDHALLAAVRMAHRARRAIQDAVEVDELLSMAPRDGDSATSLSLDGQSAPVETAIEPPTSADPFALDARLVEAMHALQTTEPRIGRLLRVVVDHRLYRSLGYAAFHDYVRERLGISVRKTWALLKIEKATLRSEDFGRAYREGRLSWVRALTLLPVLDRAHAPAWVARAELVTVRRLCDEVDWVLAARDAVGPHTSLAPPPLDGRLSSPVAVPSVDECRNLSLPARVQIGAHGFASEVCDAEVRLVGPASVVALLRDVLDAFAEPAAPRWTALERLLRHVIAHWESAPRHHDPVFARDGWRCTVPACSSRRSLHDHHIRFRSRGGDNLRANRTVVCAAHHLHGIHDGIIHASGTAPHAIEWQLGVRPGAPPFLRYVGDRRC